MRTSIRFSFMALFAGFVLLLGACSTDSAPPEGIAFAQDDSSGDQQEPVVDDTTTTTTAAPTSTIPRVNRPTNRTCSTSDHSLAFDETVVLITPTPTMAGPFAVAIPAGTYDITVSSWLGFEDYADHTLESWYFSTDSGYTSPLSTDASPELIHSDLFSSQTVPASTSITLHHKSPSAALPNSVHPLCIGFRAVAAPATTTTTTTTTTEAPAVIAAAQTTTTTTTVAPTTTTVATEAPTQLALTGASEFSMSLGLAGAALLLAGSATLIAARRSEED